MGIPLKKPLHRPNKPAKPKTVKFTALQRRNAFRRPDSNLWRLLSADSVPINTSRVDVTRPEHLFDSYEYLFSNPDCEWENSD